MASGTYLGISLTPRHVRCVVADTGGDMLATSTAPLNSAESREPNAWWLALKSALAELSGTGTGNGNNLSAIEAVGLAGTAYGAVFLDENGEAMVPAVIAGDRGADAYCAYLEATARRSRAITGSLAKADMLGVALLHLREETPQAFKRLAQVLSPKDYLLWRLTGRKVTDPSTASASLLYDPVEKVWAPRILKPLGLQADELPEIIDSGASAGSILETISIDTGLPEVPVIAGTSDLASTCLSLGLARRGESLLALGRQTVLARLSDTFLPDPFRHIDMRAFATGDLFYHLADTGPAADFDAWSRSLGTGTGQDAPGNELYFLPHLEHGAALAGLSPQTTPQDIAHAVKCGAAFEIAESLGALNDLLATEEPLHLLASASLGQAWGPFLASATDTSLTFHEDDGFSIARGAAYLAAKGGSDAAGDQLRARPEPTKNFTPQPDLKAQFDRIQPKLAGLKSRLTHPG